MTMFLSQSSHKRSTFSNKKKSADCLVSELRAKMHRIKIRLLDCQNQNQILRKEMLMAKKVVATELLGGADADVDKLIHQASTSNYQGNREKILLLKEKLNHLENRIKEIEEGGGNELAKPSTKLPKLVEATDPQLQKTKKCLDKEVQYLLERSQHIKQKMEYWKKKSSELAKEEESLRLELERLQEKSKEDKKVQKSYRTLDRELRARQTEKLDLRGKLGVEQSRNKLLDKELAALKEDISATMSKSSDERTVIEALKSQNEYLHDLLDRERLIMEQDNWRFREDLREIQMKHACNKTTLDHLMDVVEQQDLDCKHLQEATSKESSDDNEEESSVSAATDSETQSVASPTSVENDAQSEGEQVEEGESSLREEYQMYKDLYWSVKGEKEQLSRTVWSNNEKVKSWISQLLQTRSLYFQKCAENRDLEVALKKLERTKKKGSSSSSGTSPNFTDELIRKGDVLMEEYQFLRSLWEVSMNDTGNSLNVLMTALDCCSWIFGTNVANIDLSSDDDLSPSEPPDSSPQPQEVPA